VLQSPQWRTSSLKLAHQPSQLSAPTGHDAAHAPFAQTRSEAQAFPHEPQCAGSSARIAHVPPQKMPPFVHSLSLFALEAGGGGSAVEPAAHATTRLAVTAPSKVEKRKEARPEGLRRERTATMPTSTPEGD
jgi:hypothetical protein